MKRSVLIGCFVLLLLASPFVVLWVSTQFEIGRIERLEGNGGSFITLTKPIRTHYSALTNAGELERAQVRLGRSTLSNLYVVRFNGEGIPYFYGWVAYDTGQQHVVRAVVDQLW